jgi:hypothetical protein
MMLAIGACLAVILLVAVLVIPPPSPSLPSVAAVVNVGPTNGTVNRSFFGVDVQEVGIGGRILSDRVNTTPLSTFRFSPSGEATDQVHAITYSNSGVAGPVVGFTDPQFVDWCLQRACRAIMMVPAEVNNTSLAVATVDYVEHTLGFHPAYWSIGNEPQQWQHWGIPWSQWRMSDHSTPTPLEYGIEVKEYASALRAVDPSIRLIGIESVGGGAAMFPWFNAVIQLAGHSLAAVSYHAYPAGLGAPNATLAQFYGYLGHHGGFPQNYPGTLANVQRVCPGCHLQVFVDEFNSALGSGFDPYLEGYPNAVFVAASLTESIQEGIPTVDYFDLADLNPQLPYSMLYTGGQARPTYVLYSTILENLTMGSVHAVNFTPRVPGVYAVETQNGTHASLLVVNSNLTEGIRLSWVGPTLFTSYVWDWSPSNGEPQLSEGTGSTWVRATVPPEGILLVNLSP